MRFRSLAVACRPYYLRGGMPDVPGQIRLVSGWLGGELVYIHGVAVTTGANVHAKPSQLPNTDRDEPRKREAA